MSLLGAVFEWTVNHPGGSIEAGDDDDKSFVTRYMEQACKFFEERDQFASDQHVISDQGTDDGQHINTHFGG